MFQLIPGVSFIGLGQVHCQEVIAGQLGSQELQPRWPLQERRRSPKGWMRMPRLLRSATRCNGHPTPEYHSLRSSSAAAFSPLMYQSVLLLMLWCCRRVCKGHARLTEHQRSPAVLTHFPAHSQLDLSARPYASHNSVHSQTNTAPLSTALQVIVTKAAVGRSHALAEALGTWKPPELK